MNNTPSASQPLPEDREQPAAKNLDLKKPSKKPSKKPYETPLLTKHGTVGDLTLNSGLSGTDNPNGTPPVGSHP